MNLPKVSDEEYINFLIATPRACSGTEAARTSPAQESPPAHDAFTRLLHRLEPDAATLWREASTQVALRQGILVIDDSTLDKPYARKIELVSRHWSGKHREVVAGIGSGLNGGGVVPFLQWLQNNFYVGIAIVPTLLVTG